MTAPPVFAADCLAGRRILVTGASSGLGRAAAIGLSRFGATVTICARNPERLAETRRALAGEGHAVVEADLQSADAAADLVKSVSKDGGRLDGVYHAAGVSMTLPVRLTKQAAVDEVFGPSVHAAFGIARAAGMKDVMAERSSLIFMSSISALRGHNGMMVYSGAKAAVHGLTRSAAVELAPKGVRVNTVVSGSVYTEMYAREVDRMGQGWIDGIGAKHPLGFGETDDITNAVVFLLSDASKWITGTTMTVDGGYLAQ